MTDIITKSKSSNLYENIFLRLWILFLYNYICPIIYFYFLLCISKKVIDKNEIVFLSLKY